MDEEEQVFEVMLVNGAVLDIRAAYVERSDGYLFFRNESADDKPLIVAAGKWLYVDYGRKLSGRVFVK